MTHEEAVFVLGKELSERRRSGKPMRTTKVWILSSYSYRSPAELADEYERRSGEERKMEPPGEETLRRARFMALPEKERLAPLPLSQAGDTPYGRACRSFNVLIAAMLAANSEHVANSIADYRWRFISPGASPKEQLEAIRGVSGGFFSKGEWDRVAECGGMSCAAIKKTMLRLYQYLEILPLPETEMAFIREHISSFKQ